MDVDHQLPSGYVEEAPLPEGFPPPSEPGKVTLKKYPASRTYSATGQKAFLKLFGYLTFNQHKMTAPVIMTYRGQAAAKGKKVEAEDAERMELPVKIDRMHFILQHKSLDEPKDFGLIRVEDVAAVEVLSLASQGDMDAAQIEAATKELHEELDRRGDLEAAGPPRLLGYNSPSVSAKKRFWELQLPVKRKSSE